MRLGILHLEGKPVGTLPNPLTGTSRTIFAGDEVAQTKTLDEAIAAAKRLTAGPARQGAYVMGGSRGYEVYLANLEATPGGAKAPFHFEGWHQKFPFEWPKHTLDVGQAFVDGDTVLRRS